jgi:general secretion pathway protein A
MPAGLTRQPRSLEPSSRFKATARGTLTSSAFSDEVTESPFCPTASNSEQYKRLLSSIIETPGLFLIAGAPGAGKSMLLSRLSVELAARGHLVIGQYRAGLNLNELLEVLSGALGITAPIVERPAWSAQFQTRLDALARSARVVLVIDDAQRLGGRVMTALASMLDPLFGAARPLRVVLAGTSELMDRLRMPALAPLHASLSVHCEVRPLALHEVGGYILHRLRHAGCATDLFSSDAVEAVARLSDGIPRQINRLCARAAAISEQGGEKIAAEMVSRAAASITGESAAAAETSSEPRRLWWHPYALSIGIAAAASLAYLAWAPAERVPMPAANPHLAPIVDKLMAPPTQVALPLNGAVRGESPEVGAVVSVDSLADDSATRSETSPLSATHDLVSDRIAATEELEEPQHVRSTQQIAAQHWRLDAATLREDVSPPVNSLSGSSEAKRESEAVAPREAITTPPDATMISEPGSNEASDSVISYLLRRGDELLATGDVSAARLFYERAAKNGSVRAAVSSGKTFDPRFFKEAGIRGARPELELAKRWYRRAAELGDAEALFRLESLGERSSK